MIELKSPAEIGRMRVTGEFVASVLAELSSLAAPGVNLLDLEQRAREMVSDRGAVSCYWDYSPSFGRGPFRNVICLPSMTLCCMDFLTTMCLPTAIC